MYALSDRAKVAETRPKYREPPSEQKQRTSGNVMYDRRVFRGNTFVRHAVPTAPQPAPAVIRRKQPDRPRATGRRAVWEQLRLQTTETLQGRKHMHVQTEVYLEELADVVVTAETTCQTDAFLDRPASPLFTPAKSGEDVSTQVEEGELFDFDVEVQPVLEVLVGKTVEQSLLEVMEEEELACLNAQQRTFEQRRYSELAEVQRLQEQDRRRIQEKERRITQQKEVLRKEKETAEKVAARAYTNTYLASLLPAVFTSLRGHGFFYDPVERYIETNSFPWLMAEVNNNLKQRATARQTLDMIIRDVVEKRLEAFKETQQLGSDT